ncbi:hypothetical protein vBKpnAMK6_00472 [Klebsiella phage vB_Kpn_AM_K6]
MTLLLKAKGIEDSYKFLFKLLYNEDVEIDIESKNTTEYDIIVESLVNVVFQGNYAVLPKADVEPTESQRQGLV